MSRFDKPIIAAVNGLGVGIGFTMLLHCDIVVMATPRTLRAPFVPLGVVPEAAGSVLMPLVMGSQRAALALYTGSWLSAADALDAGIAWKSVPDSDLLAEAFAVAGESRCTRRGAGRDRSAWSRRGSTPSGGAGPVRTKPSPLIGGPANKALTRSWKRPVF